MLKRNATPDTTHHDLKNQVLNYLHGLDPDTDAFAAAMTHYKALCEIDNQQKSNRANGNTVVNAAANLLGIMGMGLFEQRFNTIFTTKALSTFGNKLK